MACSQTWDYILDGGVLAIIPNASAAWTATVRAYLTVIAKTLQEQ